VSLRLSPSWLSKCPELEPGDRRLIRKSRPMAGLSARISDLFSEGQTAWLGREDSNLEMANWKSAALACPRGTTELHFVKIHKPLEKLKFREPYRIREVQSSGEK
jgi:hypothetical protein